MRSLCHYLFGWEYIAYQWGYSNIIRRVTVWPSGRKTVQAYGELAVLDEETHMLSTGRKYVALT